MSQAKCALCDHPIEDRVRSVRFAAVMASVNLIFFLLGSYYWYRLGSGFFAFMAGSSVFTFLEWIKEAMVRDIQRMRLEDRELARRMTICTRCLISQEFRDDR